MMARMPAERALCATCDTPAIGSHHRPRLCREFAGGLEQACDLASRVTCYSDVWTFKHYFRQAYFMCPKRKMHEKQ